MKKKILILISNNGTDGRFRKLIKSLKDNDFQPHALLAFPKNENHQFSNKSNLIEINNFSSTRIFYSYKNILFPFYTFFFLIYFRLKGFNRLHVCDEQALIFVPYVKLLFSKVVLDIYDSMYLKFPFLKFIIPQSVLHKLVHLIIVTDNDRLSLLSNQSKKKTIVIPNYPKKEDIIDLINLPKKIFNKNKITIGYFGSMVKDRGVEFMYNLLKYSEIDIICGGWCYDEFSKKFINHSKVTYVGILEQKEIFKMLKHKIDYLVAIYPDNNLNNIYASPNKIWEASILDIPLIINSETKISNYVKKENLGLVISCKNINFSETVNLLKNYSNNSKKTKNKFWDDSIIPLLDFYKSNLI